MLGAPSPLAVAAFRFRIGQDDMDDVEYDEDFEEADEEVW